MSTASKLMLSRAQLSAFLADPDAIRAFERLFAAGDRIEGINPLWFAPLGLAYPLIIEPLAAAPSGNVVYNTIPQGAGMYSIKIPVASLKASAGGPFTLTISTGVVGKTTVVVPIAKSTDTIDSGPLLFDVEVDAVGNLTSKGWTPLSGHNSDGSYVMFANGTLIQNVIKAAANITFGALGPLWVSSVIMTFPVPFAFIDYLMPLPSPIYAGANGLWSGQDAFSNATVSAVKYYIWSPTNVGTISVGLMGSAIGRWR